MSTLSILNLFSRVRDFRKDKESKALKMLICEGISVLPALATFPIILFATSVRPVR